MKIAVCFLFTIILTESLGAPALKVMYMRTSFDKESIKAFLNKKNLNKLGLPDDKYDDLAQLAIQCKLNKEKSAGRPVTALEIVEQIPDLVLQDDIIIDPKMAYECAYPGSHYPGSRRPKRYIIEEFTLEEGVPVPRRFPNNTVVYSVSPEAEDATYRKYLKAATDYWTEHTCITFTEIPYADLSTPKVVFIKNDGCSSFVGSVSYWIDEQPIDLGPRCQTMHHFLHEIGHALGAYHRQSGPDRDQHVTIAWNKMIDGVEHNFEIIPDSIVFENDFYDHNSTMHYHRNAFGKPKTVRECTGKGQDRVCTTNTIYLQTIYFIDPILEGSWMGGRFKASFFDLYAINQAYGCLDACGTGIGCLNRGYPDPEDCTKCRCLSGFSGDNCGIIDKTHNVNDCGSPTIDTTTASSFSISDVSGKTCTWEITADGNDFELKLNGELGCDNDDCFYTEVRMEDFTKRGASFVDTLEDKQFVGKAALVLLRTPTFNENHNLSGSLTISWKLASTKGRKPKTG